MIGDFNSVIFIRWMLSEPRMVWKIPLPITKENTRGNLDLKNQPKNDSIFDTCFSGTGNFKFQKKLFNIKIFFIEFDWYIILAGQNVITSKSI